MPFRYEGSVVVARDGSAAIQLIRLRGAEKVPNRTALGFEFEFRTGPNEEPGLLEVRFSYTSLTASPATFKVPDYGDRDANFAYFAEAAVGEHLDQHGPNAFKAVGDNLVVIDAFSPQFQAWRERQAADDDAVEEYIGNRLYFAWRYGKPEVMFTTPDLLRLGSTLNDFLRIARLGDGSDWQIKNVTTNAVFMEATQSYLQGRRKRGKQPTASAVHQQRPAPEEEVSAIVPFVDETRITDLKALNQDRFDLRKLIALCEELNVCSRAQCHFAVAMLTRAILDHVPPIFGFKTFQEVANNYGGARSFKESMQHLENSARNIADHHLHVPIRKRELLPTRTQVNFANDLDLLLAEIARHLS